MLSQHHKHHAPGTLAPQLLAHLDVHHLLHPLRQLRLIRQSNVMSILPELMRRRLAAAAREVTREMVVGSMEVVVVDLREIKHEFFECQE